MYLRNLMFIVLAMALSGGAAAEEKKMNLEMKFVSGPPEQCLSLTRIDHTEVIDDWNILYYMNGGDIYRNKLSHRCPGLGFHESFMYRTSLDQLCNVDIITVLTDIGFGFSPGASCGLGLFYPVTREDVKNLKEEIKAKAKKQ